MNTDRYHDYMAMAFSEAQNAFESGEVPVGAVVIFEGRVIGRGYNQIETLKDATAHAEMIALSAAFNYFGAWRLENCTLVCTLEPCTMCAGAAVHSRIGKIIYGAKDQKFGGCGSIFNIPSEPKLNHNIEIVSGIMEEPISMMMKEFFQLIRAKKKGAPN